MSEASINRITGARSMPTKLVAALAGASGLLQYLSFFPANFGFLGWISLVPFLILSKTHLGKGSSWLVWGIVFLQNLASLRWMMVADERMVATWILLSWWCSLFPVCALHILRFLGNRLSLPLAISTPLVWVSLEHAKAYLLTGFPWYYLAHTQHDVLPLLQTADFAGTQFLTFLVGMWNGWLADLAIHFAYQRKTRELKAFLPQMAACGAIALALLAFGLGYGAMRMREVADNIVRGPLVVAMQGNHPQSARNDASYFDAIWEDYKILLGRAKKFRPDLIIWPETSFPFEIPCKVGEAGPLLGIRKGGVDSAPEDEKEVFTGPAQLLGSGVAVLDGEKVVRRHNSSLLQDFQRKHTYRYDKIHRVPFGEYLPLKGIIPGMEYLSPYEFDYSISPGEGCTRFPLVSQNGKDYSFTTLICYEDSDFQLARLAAGGDGLPAPDFLVNQSNDGWFKGTEEHEQHLAVARFRSVETRRSMIRSVNMGVSAVIDPAGRVLAPEPREGIEGGYFVGEGAAALSPWEWHKFKNKPLLLGAVIPISQMDSPYITWGDWLAWTVDVFLVGLVIWSIRLGAPKPEANT